jgi:hypothetical protein
VEENQYWVFMYVCGKKGGSIYYYIRKGIMKKFILMFTCVLCFLVSGCMNTIENVPTIIATGTMAYVGHEPIVEVIIINLDVFNASELEQLTKVNNRMCAVKNKVNIMWQKKDGDVAELVMDLPKLLPLYYKAREAYLVAHDIIMSRIDEFSTIERGILMRYSDNCARLDAAIQEAAISENGTDNIQLVRDILVFVFLVGKVVLPMLLVL